mmetsp:Transcript_6131/g.9564  ORF Transcript_6131/g.9564 Transcript_6131/m.9564 type:complete len:147 (-) Transcript_6131:773-1213(-)
MKSLHTSDCCCIYVLTLILTSSASGLIGSDLTPVGFEQSSHLQLSPHGFPEEKHAQYIFRQRDFLHRHDLSPKAFGFFVKTSCRAIKTLPPLSASVFAHDTHLQLSTQILPSRKHAQYSFKHFDCWHLHPSTFDFVSFTGKLPIAG